MTSGKHYYIVSVLLCSIIMAGCVHPTRLHERADGNIIKMNHSAAENLITQSQGMLSRGQPILVASFVNIDNLLSSSTFGRMTAEQVASKLSQSGYPVVEMKLRNNVFIKEQSGEFILSRELKSIGSEHDAQAVLGGTYAVGENEVYVTSKLIRTTDGVILSSYDYELPLGPNTRELLNLRR